MYILDETSIILQEELDKEQYKPVFILITEGKTPILSNTIRAATKSPFTHCSISFDIYLRKIYTYMNFRIKEGKIIKGGFKEQTLFQLNNDYTEVYCIFVENKIYNKLLTEIKDYKNHETKYDFRRMVAKLFKDVEGKDKYKQVCSSFVYDILKSVGVQLTPNEIKCASPKEIYEGIINNKTAYLLYKGGSLEFDAVKAKTIINNLYNKKSTKKFENILTESIKPDQVDRSNYEYFLLFNLFNIYTTDLNLKNDKTFLNGIKWVKEHLCNLAIQMNFTLQPIEITLCGSFEDLDEFYNHEAPKWVTGFTWGNKIYLKSPNIYKGELWYNILLHELIHAMIFDNVTAKGKYISLRDNEGMAVFFSTPLNKWLKELNHNGNNWFYYESAIDIQEDYLNGGMKLVLQKRIKNNKP